MRWLANLNVFVAAAALLMGLGAWVLLIPLSMLLKLAAPARQAELVAMPLAYALIFIGLALYGWRRGLSPARRKPGAERRYRIGHGLLALCNVALVAVIVMSVVAPYFMHLFSGKPLAGPSTISLLMMSPTLMMLAGVAGLVMVLGSRAPEPGVAMGEAFPDTIAQGQGVPRVPSAQWPPPATGKVQGAVSSLPALAGLVVSGFLIFISLVFAALGFQSDPKKYTSTFLPIAGAVIVVYVSAVIWLMATGRQRPANLLAWSPVLLLLVGGPVMQMLAMLFGMLTGK